VRTTQPKILRTLEAAEVAEAISVLSHAIETRHGALSEIALVGIANGGVPLAERLAARLATLRSWTVYCGTVNIAYHRDDIGSRPVPMVSHPTHAPFDLDGATVILVDDVVSSGRSVRAGLNELFDLGRPSRVEVATLFDCLNYRLPLRADYCGIAEKIPEGQSVKVHLDNVDPANDRIEISQG